MAQVNNVCLKCGKIFRGNQAAIYCNECLQEMKQEKTPKSKGKPKYTTNEAVQMAKNDGLSYGYEVAKLEGRI